MAMYIRQIIISVYKIYYCISEVDGIIWIKLGIDKSSYQSVLSHKIGIYGGENINCLNCFGDFTTTFTESL